MRNNFWMKLGGASSVTALLTGLAMASPPPADTRIGNQAAATFESNGETFTVQSNLVETIVNEVFDVDLSNDQTKESAPGGIVTFPHTITNNGNTDDVFDLVTSVAGGPSADSLALTDPNVVIYPDADQDGVPDSLTPITETPAILAGDSFGVIVQATIPGSATTTQSADFTLTATSQSDPAVTEENTDTVTISSDGILDVQKEQVLAVDADGDGVFSVGDTVEVTLSYSNIGIGTSTGIVITDDLPAVDTDGNPITLTYVDNSAEWSDAPSVTLSDDVDTPDPYEQTNAQGVSIDYSYDDTSLITVKLDALDAGRSGSVTFDYVIAASGDGTFNNIANFLTDTQSLTPSNISPVTISPTAVFVLADAAATAATPAGGTDGANLSGADASSTDDDGGLDDIVTDSGDVYLGQTTAFDFVLTNLGNASDFFEISVANTDFPAGTTFEIVGEDGVTPLISDEVLVPAGETRHVQVIARFPSDASAATSAPAGFDAVVTATSQSDPSLTNSSGLSFTGALLAPPVDLETYSGASDFGTGNGNVDDGGDAWQTESLKPGETAVFPLRVSVAAGAPANSFDLLASTDGTFATEELPEGWVLEFYDSNGQLITNTGVLTPTATDAAVFEYEARITLPEDAAPVDDPGTNIFFRAESPLNGASDTVQNAVIVEEVIDLAIESDQQMQAAPGGVVAIPHSITNLGNVTITGGAVAIGGTDPFGAGLTSDLYYDANGDGVLDPTDPLISDISSIPGGIAPGESVQIFARVQTPAGSTFGLSEVGDVTLSASLTSADGGVTDSDTTNNTVLDTVTIISGDVVVEKMAGVDTDCNGTPEAASDFSIAPLNADPGHCIVYQITADNTGSSIAENVILNDATPSYTSIEICDDDADTSNECVATLDVDGNVSTPGTLPGDEATGSISSTATPGTGFTLNPGSRAVLTFTVQIDE